MYDRKDFANWYDDIGLIAEQVYPIVPAAVSLSANNNIDNTPIPVGIDYGRLVAVLIEAIKELKIQVNDLSGKV